MYTEFSIAVISVISIYIYPNAPAKVIDQPIPVIISLSEIHKEIHKDIKQCIRLIWLQSCLHNCCFVMSIAIMYVI